MGARMMSDRRWFGGSGRRGGGGGVQGAGM